MSEQIKRLREKRDELDKQRDELDNQISKLSALHESQQQITLHSDVKVKGNCQQLRSSAKFATWSHDDRAA